MKRVISFIITVVILTGMSGAYAEEVNEILWQNIPWGSNQNEVSSYLKNMDGVDANAPIMEIGMFNSLLITNSKEKVLQYPIDIGLKSGSDAMYFGYQNPIFDYKVNQIMFTFNNIQGKFELVGVGITLEHVDKADLMQKLSAIYGYGEEYPDGSFVWKGDLETAVCVGNNGELIYGEMFDVNIP